jgi:hypothetical protein
MGEGHRGLPEPIAIFIPTAIRLHPDFGENMMEKKTPISSEIAKGLIMGVWFVASGKCLG